jgi:hypothetical protein
MIDIVGEEAQISYYSFSPCNRFFCNISMHLKIGDPSYMTSSNPRTRSLGSFTEKQGDLVC